MKLSSLQQKCINGRPCRCAEIYFRPISIWCFCLLASIASFPRPPDFLRVRISNLLEKKHDWIRFTWRCQSSWLPTQISHAARTTSTRFCASRRAGTASQQSIRLAMLILPSGSPRIWSKQEGSKSCRSTCRSGSIEFQWIATTSNLPITDGA